MTGELILTTILPRKVAKPDRETEIERETDRESVREIKIWFLIYQVTTTATNKYIC